MSKRVQFWKTARGAMANVLGDTLTAGPRSIPLLLVALSVSAPAKAQLPDAPSPSVVAPLKRYSLNIGLDNKYSLTTSQYDLTPRLGVSIRVAERETLGFSFSHATVMNNRHVQNNSVVMWLNFRVMSWGKIPRE